MHIKFTAHGKGSARRAADYLTQQLDSKGIERAGVEILRGDPHDVAYVADNLSFLNRYRLGVIGWAPGDKPTDDHINEVLDELERAMFGGLDSARFCWSAVFHREVSGGCHIHIFCACVDLVTGKSYNIAPPGWIQTYQPLRDFFNNGYGWAKPDDPARRKVLDMPRHKRHIKPNELQDGLEVEHNPRELITDYLLQQIISGAVVDRSSLVAALHGAQLETPRLSKKYITVYDPKSGGRWRLKGAIYDESWAAGQAVEADQRRREGTCDQPDEARARIALAKLSKRCRERAEYNFDRYKFKNKAPTGKDSNFDPGGMDTAPDGGPGDDDRPSNWQLGIVPILLTPDRRSICPGGSGQANPGSSRRLGDTAGGRRPREIYGVARGSDYCRWVADQRAGSIQARSEGESVESVRSYDPHWRQRSVVQRQYYILYRHNIDLEEIQDWQIWENKNGRFLKNYKGYHVWDKGDKLILRKADDEDLRVAVALMLQIAEDKGWDLPARAELATGTEEFLSEVRRQVAEKSGQTHKAKMTRGHRFSP